ncbi:ImmA/IrrE family metallo-endopeptidase [Clostridium botulinum]|nr:ImmA/IrrE family metallo-endopeptidase [Clostridium botulinum]NFG21838.1 ImmA/IrrE family metallo-endopeptidase [Clostridium botulinum]NFL39753.1 ImmA/IrrE family metallo-endopeptidase [Clostridium botulinum]NFL66699.1 ImmA/IrrE family metallo-endopeptidase [Clostridium botulinum]NFN09608.1 ImmA/IrrE family metallo-endopeptidase [Clostridium botulinum]
MEVDILCFVRKEYLKLINKHKTTDPIKLCELEKIKCEERDLHSEINGIYQYVARNRFIFINKNLNSIRKRFTYGHELGHAVLHTKQNFTFLKTHTLFNVNKFEREADLFSSLLLIPNLSKDMFEGKTIKEVAFELKVPEEILEIRLSICDFMK